MLNQATVEALYSASYLEDYLDYVENIPNDIQRNISSIRELDVDYQENLNEITKCESLLQSNAETNMLKKALRGMQHSLIRIQELGDEKIDVVQKIQDVTENKFRKIDMDYRNLDIGQDNDTSNDPVTKDSGFQPERPNKRPRRQRNNDTINDTSLHSEIKNEKETTTNQSNKKQKKKRRKTKAEKEREQRSPSVEPPIDPDEPTYCLCEQVSFGEMIGCDNVSCPIEWFHFSCVQLTSKPKGKWYCPQCRGDRSNQPKPNLGKTNS